MPDTCQSHDVQVRFGSAERCPESGLGQLNMWSWLGCRIGMSGLRVSLPVSNGGVPKLVAFTLVDALTGVELPAGVVL